MQDELALWLASPKQLVLEGPTVHVWRARLARDSTEITQLEQTLSEDERARADRFHFEAGRRRYVVARGLLRALLARYTGQPPEALRFAYGQYGKPALEKGYAQRTLHFNASHSHDLALYAFTRAARVGVDVERVEATYVEEQAAAQILSQAEMAMLRDAPEREKATVFYKLWTRKEAYGKAIGKGIAPSLQRVTLSLAPHQSVVVPVAGGESERPMLVQEIQVGPHHAAAAAIEGRGMAVHCWHWPDQGAVTGKPACF